MADKEFENHEAQSRAGGEAGVHQPKGSGRHRLVKAADVADKAVGAEESAQPW